MSIGESKAVGEDAARDRLLVWHAPRYRRIDARSAEFGFSPGLDGGLDSS